MQDVVGDLMSKLWMSDGIVFFTVFPFPHACILSQLDTIQVVIPMAVNGGLWSRTRRVWNGSLRHWRRNTSDQASHGGTQRIVSMKK